MFSIQKTIDSAGNESIQWSYSCPGVNDTYSIGGVSIGIGAFLAGTKLDTYKDLEGHGISTGFSVGEGLSGGVDLIAATSSKQVIQNMRSGGNTSFDGGQVAVAWSHGIDFHYTDSFTSTIFSYNYFDVLRAMNIWR